jgi:hypothetical protein
VRFPPSRRHLKVAPSAATNGAPAGTPSSPRVPSMDPGLEGFLRMLGEIAADAVLEDFRKTGRLTPVSTKSPRGPDRTTTERNEGITRADIMASHEDGVPDESARSLDPNSSVPHSSPVEETDRSSTTRVQGRRKSASTSARGGY